jgi:hypothetical protein
MGCYMTTRREFLCTATAAVASLLGARAPQLDQVTVAPESYRQDKPLLEL